MIEQATNITIVSYGVEEYPPFRAMKESLNTVKEAFGDCLEIKYVDIWDNPESIISFGFMSMPATVLYLNGEPSLYLSGYYNSRQIARKIAAVLEGTGNSKMSQKLEPSNPITRLLRALLF